MTPPTPTDLLRAYQEYAARQTFDFEPATLYGPIRYAMAKPGKQIRPLLLLQAHALGAADPTPALPAAYALELFHNFTLVHDDIMDAAPTRRGRDTVHVAYDPATAILAGDAMLIHAYGYLLDHYPGEAGARVTQTFSVMARALCAGQQRDMDLERDGGRHGRYADYLAMISGKTGALLTASLEIGGQLGGLDDEALAHLRRGGDFAGQAFQILDDVLDTFGTGTVTGKTDHGDIARGKLSGPFVRALERASAPDRARLLAIYGMDVTSRQELIPEVLQLLGHYEVERSLRAEAAQLTHAALGAFQQVGGRAEAQQALARTIAGLLGRSY